MERTARCFRSPIPRRAGADGRTRGLHGCIQEQTCWVNVKGRVLLAIGILSFSNLAAQSPVAQQSSPSDDTMNPRNSDPNSSKDNESDTPSIEVYLSGIPNRYHLKGSRGSRCGQSEPTESTRSRRVYDHCSGYPGSARWRHGVPFWSRLIFEPGLPGRADDIFRLECFEWQ
jgi:hypothetical protein